MCYTKLNHIHFLQQHYNYYYLLLVDYLSTQDHSEVLYFQGRRPTLHQDDTRNLLICMLWLLKNVDESILRQWWSELSMSKLQQILEALHLVTSNFEYKVRMKNRVKTNSTQKLTLLSQGVILNLLMVLCNMHFIYYINIVQFGRRFI